MKRESPKKGRRLPLPQKSGRPIGTKRGERGYRRSLSKADESDAALDDFVYVKPPYELIDHTADLGMIVRGQNLERLFENAGLALFDLLTKVTLVRPDSKWSISLRAENLEALLVEWLRELLYLFYGKKRLLCAFETDELTKTSLEVTCWGERYDPGRHTLITEIKAVTYHELAITRKDSGWSAQIIFDV
ncbi:MAG: archease [Candidatus Eisenbacteria bacterium]|nr:archease [Candidatus Eisenbacteria bacterium]